MRYARLQDQTAMQTQIHLILEAANAGRCNALVPSAFGCGAFGNPPWTVAALFQDALCDRAGTLEEVIFCIFDDYNTGQAHNPRRQLLRLLGHIPRRRWARRD